MPSPTSTEFLPVEIAFDYPANTLGRIEEVISENPIGKLICLDPFPVAKGPEETGLRKGDKVLRRSLLALWILTSLLHGTDCFHIQ